LGDYFFSCILSGRRPTPISADLERSYFIARLIDSFARLEYPQDDYKKNHVSEKRRYCENGQPEFVELNSWEMQCLQRF
jgi:hypothetical protein